MQTVAYSHPMQYATLGFLHRESRLSASTAPPCHGASTFRVLAPGRPPSARDVDLDHSEVRAARLGHADPRSRCACTPT